MNKESQKRVEICKKLCKKLKKELKDNLISFIIFGSTARGTAKKESDIDILLIVKDKTSAEEKYLKEKIKLPESYLFSTIITTEKNLKENPYILLDITQEHIILYDFQNKGKNLILKLKEKLKQLGAKRYWLDKNRWYWDLYPDWKPGDKIELTL